MEEYLPFVSINTWTLIFSWANLLILFLLLKKFLFKPVNKMLDTRAEEIENEYKAAEKTKSEAQSFKSDYEKRLLSAEAEADSIIKSATEAANARSESIVGEANNEARSIKERARRQIEQERKNAMDTARADIASMAVDIAGKVIGKKLYEIDDEKMILDIIDRM